MLPIPSIMLVNPEDVGYWIGNGIVYGLISGFAIGIAHKIIIFIIGGGI